MIDLAIGYLKPLLETSLNTTAMRQKQGTVAQPRSTTVFSTRGTGAAEISGTPYAKLYKSGDPAQLINQGMGRAGSLTEYWKEFLTIECVAQADTDALAQDRVEALALAVKGCLYKNKAGLAPGTLTRSDLGGTGSSEKITNWQAVSGPDPNVTGPGETATLWTAKKMVKVEVWITKQLTT